MNTEKEKMKAVDGGGRVFSVMANTEDATRKIGVTEFEELLPGDLFVSFDDEQLITGNGGAFIWLVLEPPKMSKDGLPSIQAQAINLEHYNELNARPPVPFSVSEGDPTLEVVVSTIADQKAHQFINSVLPNRLAKSEVSADQIKLGELMGGYGDFLGQRPTEDQTRALFNALNEAYEFADG